MRCDVSRRRFLVQYLSHFQGGRYTVKKSTKLVGLVAGAASLAGGLAAVPEAQASTSVFSCNAVHGTNPILTSDSSKINSATAPAPGGRSPFDENAWSTNCLLYTSDAADE